MSQRRAKEVTSKVKKHLGKTKEQLKPKAERGKHHLTRGAKKALKKVH